MSTAKEAMGAFNVLSPNLLESVTAGMSITNAAVDNLVEKRFHSPSRYPGVVMVTANDAQEDIFEHLCAITVITPLHLSHALIFTTACDTWAALCASGSRRCCRPLCM